MGNFFCKVLISFFILFWGHTSSALADTPRFKAVAFDYFVIFNPNSVVADIERILPGKGDMLARAWRAKQFEYCFLRSVTGQHADFFEVTGDALDFASASLGITLSPQQRVTLLDAYLHLDLWPDAAAALAQLKKAGLKIITIANFSERMLRANAERAGIAGLFDTLLSTEVNRSYKPEARAYELGMTTLSLKKDEILFAAFGGWDAYGAKQFGYTTYWVNRFGLPAERLGVTADQTSKDISGLVAFALNRK